MAGNESKYASRPQFRIERLQNRLLLSATLEDGSEVIDEVFTEQVPADEYVELIAYGDGELAGEGDWSDLMFYTMVDGVDTELGDPGDVEILVPEGESDELMFYTMVDPMPAEGEEVYFGGETGEDGIIYMVCGFVEDDVILGDPAETLPDEVLMTSTGTEGEAQVELAIAAPVSAPAPAASESASKDLIASDDDLLGGVDAII